MTSKSPKLQFLNKGGGSDDEFENIVHIQKNDYRPGKVASRGHSSLARTRICRGGLGSGKTRFATEHVNALALQYPGSLHFIGRKDITSLKVTTQREFLEKVVTPETIRTFNVNENILYYKNNSQVLFRETKEPDKVKSLELTSYLLDEADENPTEEIWDKLDDRLRQKIQTPDGLITPPYAGLLVFNPTDEDHWLYHLAQRKDIDLEDFRFETPDNAHNLPPGYIDNLIKKLPPWEVNRLVYGHWGRIIKGKPVYHGFTTEKNVRYLRFRYDLPLLRGWDFGYTHPAVRFAQFDPETGRYYVHREYLGSNMHLRDVVPHVMRITRELCGDLHPVMDYGDPHGADKKDTGMPSIEYLRVHHQIYVHSKRERIRSGMDELQEKISTVSALGKGHFGEEDKEESLMLVDRQCPITIAAYMGGYHRDEHGEAVKDGYYDHLCDTDRYVIVHKMNARLAARYKFKKKYVPRNLFTGY